LLIADLVRLKRGVWRYTVLPGLVELDLAARLRSIPEVTVTMWPQRDRYDLFVASGAHEWHVDVKDWSNQGTLANRLNSLDPETKITIVVPDRRKHQVPVLRERVTNANWSFASVSEFLKLVRVARGKAQAAS